MPYCLASIRSRISHRDPSRGQRLGICIHKQSHVPLCEVLSTYSGAYGSNTIGHSVGPLDLTTVYRQVTASWGKEESLSVQSVGLCVCYHRGCSQSTFIWPLDFLWNMRSCSEFSRHGGGVSTAVHVLTQLQPWLIKIHANFLKLPAFSA